LQYDLQEELKNDPQFLTEIVTGDESWCYSYDPSQSSSLVNGSHQIHPDQQKKAQQVCSSVNTMLIYIFDVYGIVHRQFVPPTQIVNQQFNLNVLK